MQQQFVRLIILLSSMTLVLMRVIVSPVRVSVGIPLFFRIIPLCVTPAIAVVPLFSIFCPISPLIIVLSLTLIFSCVVRRLLPFSAFMPGIIPLAIPVRLRHCGKQGFLHT